MNTIFKYSIRLSGTAMAMPKHQVIGLTMPQKAHILTAQIQGDELVLWAEVNPKNEVEERVIEIIGTGGPISDLKPAQRRTYISTFQLGWFVGHIFEVR